MRLLVVEDNQRVAAALQSALTHKGMEAVCAYTGKAAFELLERIHPDAVLLDVGLPDCDGFALCGEMRAASPVPILVTTAQADYASCVRGLDLGADDYLVKPYNLGEMLARVRAVLRRRRPAAPLASDTPPGDLVLAGAVRIDLRERAVLVNGLPVELSDEEFGVLVALARQPDEVIRADRLIDEILRVHREALQTSLHQHVLSLRERIGVPQLLEDVDGAGYRLSTTAVA